MSYLYTACVQVIGHTAVYTITVQVRSLLHMQTTFWVICKCI